MGQVRAFDHVGITVADLDAAAAFFVGLGLEAEGRTFVEGEFIDTVCGIPDSRTEIVMLRPPGGGTAGAFFLLDRLMVRVVSRWVAVRLLMFDGEAYGQWVWR